ncbi:MAG: alanine racemase [Clostridia bacterium]|nr:alanine racemase [Clostridia bacterium]
MQLTEKQLAHIETPCLVIDIEKARQNILSMQKQAEAFGCALRPHVKTHKMPFFAQMQVEAGAKGITCAKVSEAEVMVAGGLRDIFIAYPMVGDFRIRRALALLPKVDRLILAVDSVECATALNQAAANAGVRLEVRLEVDTGAKRTGIPHEQAAALAKTISALPHLDLTGIYTFKSLLYRGAPTGDSALAGQEEGRMMWDAAQAIRARGVALKDISAGSTPTGLLVAQTGLVTEIRPGTYIFYDATQQKQRVCTTDQIAAKIYATVVSCPTETYAVIDGGSKTFPTDFSGYGAVEGRDDLHLSRLSEEHGMITTDSKKIGLFVGQKLCLVPSHVCTAINMQNQVYLLEHGELRRQKVDARGMLV